MMNVACRHIDQMIESQVHRWQAQFDTHAKMCLAEPLIAISRLPGCAGRAIALKLALALGVTVEEIFQLDVQLETRQTEQVVQPSSPSAPEPLQTGQGSVRGTRNSTSRPRMASSKESSRS